MVGLNKNINFTNESNKKVIKKFEFFGAPTRLLIREKPLKWVKMVVVLLNL